MGLLRRLFRGRKEPVDPDAMDRAMIDQLATAGANLAEPRDVDHFLYFPTEEAAHAAGGRVSRDDRRLLVQPAASGPSWLVQVTVRMAVSEASIAAARDEFTRVAADFGGEYDGWGAPA